MGHQVPGGDDEVQRQQKDGPDKNAGGDELIAAAEILVETQEIGELETIAHADSTRALHAGRGVSAAMKHFIQIEFLTAGEIRDGDINRCGGEHGDESSLLVVQPEARGQSDTG